MIWGSIKGRIDNYEEYPTTQEELKAAIKREWYEFDQERINSLIESF